MLAILTFAASVGVLLPMPGPTNALLMASGAMQGFRRAAYLVLPVLGAFLIVILPLLLLNQLVASARDWVSLVMKSIAILLLVVLSIRMWRSADRKRTERATPPGGWTLFFVTLLNPKGLILGLVIFPPIAGAGELMLKLALFLVIAGASSLAWIGAGALLSGDGAASRSGVMARVFSVVLAAFALYLAASIVGFTGGSST